MSSRRKRRRIYSDSDDEEYEYDGFVVPDDSIEYLSDSEEEAENIDHQVDDCNVQSWIEYQRKLGDNDKKVQFVLSYPWNTVTEMPITLKSSARETREFWNNVFKLINDNVSYMEEAVEELVNIVSRTIVNPTSKRKPILITGFPGVGKTRLLTKVFGPVLGVPIEYINVSGYTREDLTSLKGSNGVWQGSGPSCIIHAIHKAQTKNMIIVFDEFDKIFDVQVYHFFNQLFDDSSSFFMDQFIEGLPFDISQITFVCMTNSNEMIPEPLMTRFKKKIYIKPPNNKEKIVICQKHNIPEIIRTLDLNVYFSDEILAYIIYKKQIKDDSGMRELVNTVESITEKINTIRVLRGNSYNQNQFSSSPRIKFPLIMTKEWVDKLMF